MNKKVWQTLACITMASITAFSVTACKNNTSGGNKDEVTTIRVDLHGWTPTINSTSTAGVKAFNSPKYIAKEFETLHKNKVKIEWVRDKDLTLSAEDIAQYFSLAIEQNACPSIAFTWGTTFQERGWYVDLTQYLSEQNSYEDATDLKNKPWREAFDEYVWHSNRIQSYDGKIVAVPLTVFAGSASAVYYNVAKVKDLGYVENANPSTINDYEFGITNPVNWSTWLELAETAKGQNAKYLIDLSNYPATSNNWLMQFELGPAYLSYATQFIDTDHNGYIDNAELLQGTVDGYLNPVTQPYAKELLTKCKYYMSMLSENNLDTQEWLNGNAVAAYKGSVGYTPQKDENLPYKWEMVPTPVCDDSQYTKDYVTWGSLDDAKPDVDLYLNVMRAGVTKDGTLTGEIDENKLYYSVEFLKYLTTREANSAMIDEMNTSIGAVKGADKPAWLSKSAYAKCQFATTTNSNAWPSGFTLQYNTALDAVFSSWVKGTGDYKNDDVFFAEWNRLQVAGARDMAQKLNITLTSK